MSRPAAHALWLAAPGRLFRTPAWLALVLVAATLIVASAVAPALFAASARETAFESGLRRAADAPYGPESADLRVTWTATLDQEGEQVVLDRLAALPAYDDPVITATGIGQSGIAAAVAKVGDRTSPAVLWYHDGAVQALAGDASPPPGVWLPTATAAALGLRPGDELRIGLDRTFSKPRFPRTVLAGTYDTEPGSTLPDALRGAPDAARWFLPDIAEKPGVGAPLAVTDRATFDKLVKRAGDSPYYLAELQLRDGVTPDEASDAAAAVTAIGAEAFDPGSELGVALSRSETGPAELEVISGLDVISQAADSTAERARDQVGPYAVAGRVLAVVVLVAAWALLIHGRRREQLLLSGLGLRPTTIALLAVVEVLPVALLSGPAGLGLALLGLRTAGPGGGSVPALTQADLLRTAAAVAAVLLLVGVTTLVLAVSTDRMALFSRFGRVRRPLPWVLALLAVTGVVAATVYAADANQRPGMGLTVALPLLVVASIAVLMTRALAWVRPRLPKRARPSTPRWLAARRTGTVVRDLTALAAVVAIALGVFLYALTVRQGIEDGIRDKTAALAGAPTTIGVGNGLRAQGIRKAVQAPAPGTTVVWSRGVGLPPAYGDDRLMAIDPETFADVADWGATGELEAARPAISKLLPRAKGLPAIVIGDSDLHVGDRGTLDFSDQFQVPFVVVGRAAAFPGAALDGARTTVVVSSRRLFRLTPRSINPRAKPVSADKPAPFTSTVWYAGPPAEGTALLRRAGVAPDGEVDTADAQRVGAGLVASAWAAAYVLALGVVVVALALAAVLVLALRLADRDRTADVLLRRMGYSSQELARARVWEAAYAVASAVLVAVVATGVLVLAPTTIDAVAAVPPLTRPRWGPGVVLTAGALVVLMLLLVWLVSTWRTSRHDAAEVLRGGD